MPGAYSCVNGHLGVPWGCVVADTRAVMGTRRGTRVRLVSRPREVPANAVGICRGHPWAVLGPRWATHGPC